MWRVLFLFVACCHTLAVPHQRPKVHDILVLGQKMNRTFCAELMQLSQNATNTTQFKTTDQSVFRVVTDAVETYVTQYDAFFNAKNQDAGYHLRNRTVDSVLSVPSFHQDPQMLVGVIAFLNAEVAGGELEFPRQSLKVEPDCGKVVVFPNHYTFPWLFRPIRLGVLHYVVTYFY